MLLKKATNDAEAGNYILLLRARETNKANSLLETLSYVAVGKFIVHLTKRLGT